MRETRSKAPQSSGGEQCTPDDGDRTPSAHPIDSEPDLTPPGVSVADLDGQPDLGPLRALAERTELADAIAGLTDAFGNRLSDADPMAPLARDIARSLVEAGFTLHHCSRTHPGYRLGGVCLLPVCVQHGYGEHGQGVVVSWTTHDLLSLDWDRYGVYRDVHQVMNAALAQALHALGYAVRPFGTGGASIVTGHRAQDEETRR